MSAKQIVILLSILCFVSLSSAIYNYPEKWKYKTLEFEVPVDHFSFAVNKTFKIRYLYNDTFWDEDEGPIFFYTGNEGTIELFAQHTGFLWEIAPEFKALVVFAEHRYYGKSMPFGNKSLTAPEYSGYLTTSQALADYADLITFLQKGKRRPVIAFGGSYGGMLSAYFRMKYPHLVAGAIAGSAPVLQFTGMVPCDAYSIVTSSSYSSESRVCYKNIKKSWSTIRNIASTPEGKTWLSKEWNVCKEIKGPDEVINYLTEMYSTLAMMNYPFECDFMVPLPAYPVRQFCSFLSNDSLVEKPLLQALHKAVNIYVNYTGKTNCFDLSGSSYNPDLGDDGWDYQSCTEMVMPMCSTGKSDMFEPSPWSEETFTKTCKARWGVEPSFRLAEKEYGGKNLEAASNIVFSNGLLDPWASGGVLKNYSDSVQAILIPEGAHHVDLMADRENDPFSIRWARSVHKTAIASWIEQFD